MRGKAQQRRLNDDFTHFQFLFQGNSKFNTTFCFNKHGLMMILFGESFTIPKGGRIDQD